MVEFETNTGGIFLPSFASRRRRRRKWNEMRKEEDEREKRRKEIFAKVRDEKPNEIRLKGKGRK